jgi:formate/nitrite transporter
MGTYNHHETAQLVIEMGVKKTNRSALDITLMGMVGTILVGVGVIIYFNILGAFHHTSPLGAKLVGAFVFPFGLLTITLVGGELYTSNTLATFALLQKRIKMGPMLRMWGISWLGNFLGAVVFGYIAGISGILESSAQEYVKHVVDAKLAQPWGAMLFSAFLCNMMISLTVWSSLACKDSAGKILSVWLIIMVFVLSGYQHIVVNSLYLTLAWLAGGQYAMGDVIKFLVVVTIGNTLSGGVFLPLVYNALYFRKQKTEPLAH